METIKDTIKAVAGAGIIEAVPTVIETSASTASLILQTSIQLAIGVLTIWRIFKRKR